MKKQLVKLLIFLFVAVSMFLLFNADLDNAYIMGARFERLVSLLVVSMCIAYSTIIFQTISGNKILTPSLMGYEHLFVFSQVLLLLVAGSESKFFKSKEWSFVFASAIMICYSLILYLFFFRNNKRNVYYILLIGLILGIFFNTTTQFLQMTVDPNEFGYIQGAIFSSLGRTSITTILISITVTSLVMGYLLRSFRELDIMALGRSYSMSLGVNYDQIAKKQLLGISVLVAISTALIGPITFVGVFISNIAYRVCNSNNHFKTVIIAFLICFITMIIAQFAIEHLFNYRHSIGVLINLIGGVYFVVIILKILRN